MDLTISKGIGRVKHGGLSGSWGVRGPVRDQSNLGQAETTHTAPPRFLSFSRPWKTTYQNSYQGVFHPSALLGCRTFGKPDRGQQTRLGLKSTRWESWTKLPDNESTWLCGEGRRIWETPGEGGQSGSSRTPVGKDKGPHQQAVPSGSPTVTSKTVPPGFPNTIRTAEPPGVPAVTSNDSTTRCP